VERSTGYGLELHTPRKTGKLGKQRVGGRRDSRKKRTTRKEGDPVLLQHPEKRDLKSLERALVRKRKSRRLERFCGKEKKQPKKGNIRLKKKMRPEPRQLVGNHGERQREGEEYDRSAKESLGTIGRRGK